MRTIKFRAWDSQRKCIWFPDAFKVIDNTILPSMVIDGIEQCNEEILMQFTWLLDKNGKEIYEGDVTESWWAILFYKWMFAPYYDYGNQERYEDIWTDWWSDCEIVWNLYENPELLQS